MSTKTQQRIGASSLGLLAIAFIFAVIVSNQLFKGARFDLTENNLYTLSEGTKRIIENIEEPLNLYFYFSDQATEDIPQIRSYAVRVREMLEEFENISDGSIRLSVIDPLPFSEEEDQAAQFGLQGAQLAIAADPVFLGLAGTNSVGDEEIVPFFQPDKESTLEYDIAKLVSTLASPAKSAIGLIAGVSMTSSFDPQSQRMQPSWVAYQQADQMFEIRELGTTLEAIPDDIDLLWIVQPRDLPVPSQYAIDQFILRGGKALIFVDPVASIDAASMEGMPQGMPPMGQASNLPLLFEAWGLEFSALDVVADSRLALPISSARSSQPIRHYGYLGLTADQMSADDIITADLSTINMAMAGQLKIAADAAATFEPILTTSQSSTVLPATRFSFLPDPSTLQDGFSPDGENIVVAARIGGTLPTAFPNGKPGDNNPVDDESGDSSPHIAESQEPANIIVVTDVDMLTDPMWVQVQNFFGQQIANAFASNGAFVVNALENLAGSSDLIAVRSRGSFARPFTKVEELRANAEARFRDTEQRLQQDLADTEQRLGELQSSREDSGSLLLTPEQQAEIDRFVDQRSAIRKELRAVQRGLDEEIEGLGSLLQIVNIGLVPFLLTLATLLTVWRRRQVLSS